MSRKAFIISGAWVRSATKTLCFSCSALAALLACTNLTTRNVDTERTTVTTAAIIADSYDLRGPDPFPLPGSNLFRFMETGMVHAVNVAGSHRDGCQPRGHRLYRHSQIGIIEEIDPGLRQAGRWPRRPIRFQQLRCQLNLTSAFS